MGFGRMYDPDHDPFPLTGAVLADSRPKMFAITARTWVALDHVATVSLDRLPDGPIMVIELINGKVYRITDQEVINRFIENWEVIGGG